MQFEIPIGNSQIEPVVADESILRGLAESLPQMVWAADSCGRKTFCSERYLRYTGAQNLEEMDQLWSTFIHPDDRVAATRAWQNALISGQPYECQYRLRRKDGAYRNFLAQATPARDANGRIVSWIGSSTDVHEQKLVESALRKSEKLAIAGRLAANIAHEVNNPLTSATNAVYLALQDPTLSEASRTYLKLADNELRRLARLTRQTLRFHRQAAEPLLVDIRELMDSVLEAMVPVHLGIHPERRYQDCGKVLCYADDVKQALASVLANSLDAMPEGGRLAIRIRCIHLSNQEVSCVRVTIADGGSGIPPALLQTVCEPFVTTKAATGTGLGMWVTKGIMERHGGLLRIRSSTNSPRRGTTVTLLFPYSGVLESK